MCPAVFLAATCSTFLGCMPLGTRVQGVGKVLPLLGALLATYVLFAGAAMRVGIRAREVQVPDLSGRTVRDAATLLADLGLTLRVDENRRVDPKMPAGEILQQRRSSARSRRGASARTPRPFLTSLGRRNGPLRCACGRMAWCSQP